MRKNHRWVSAALALALVGAASAAALPADAADRSLKDLMKKMQAQTRNGDVKGLAPLFDQTKAKGQPEYPRWAALSDKGKASAASGDLAGAKATCKECHDAYKSAYKDKYGSKAP